jgi:hypothetical protein
MPIDFSKIRAAGKAPIVVDPIDIFQRLKISDRSINDLWLAQGDALRGWHASRGRKDVAITLNTGAGKTLVGLLTAQSLVNETRGKVLYACGSIQLVEQTYEKATGYGLSATTYVGGAFSNTLFHEAEAACLTTYQALFNGKSVFFRDQIDAIIFDDAHAAEHLLRDHFSLRISQQRFGALYQELRALFAGCFHAIGKEATFAELGTGQGGQVLLVPPSQLHLRSAEFMRLLLGGGLDKSVDTLFAWEHLKDRIDLCAVLISGGSITITPPFVPVMTLPYFSGDTRRVYLSATLVSKDAFARTFGRLPEEVIAPSTTAGECERLILLPSLAQGVDDDVDAAQRVLAETKTLVLVPTHRRAAEWEGFAESPPSDQVTERVNQFKASDKAEKLLLAARYDGVDLPGDTCRAMVVDDLPMGVGPLERFLWESLKLTHGLRSTIASRIVQSFGRISRGMSDHGVVLLTGDGLIKWLLVPKNRAILPVFLQKQLDLALALSRNSGGIEDMKQAVVAFFTRDAGWIEAYRRFMAEAVVEGAPPDLARLAQLALAEAEYASCMWHRDYARAPLALSATLDVAFEESQPLGGWHALWLGRCAELAGDHDSARELYKRAHGAAKNLPPYQAADDAAVAASDQVIEMEQCFLISAAGVKVSPRLSPDLVHLKGEGSAAQTEEALRALGEYLGLDSSRPEKEHGTGPDVLWIGPDDRALCMEVKSGKDDASSYRKRDVGQLSDHVQWVRDNSAADEVVPLFVGPLAKPTATANPPPEFLVADLTEFLELASRLAALTADVAANSLPITLRASLADALVERKLDWPAVLETIKMHRLRDL